jgi:hypothetical protein
MLQKNIRPYEGDSYSIEEGSELILELDARTKSSRAGLNSMDEIGAQVEILLNTGRYVGHYLNAAQLNNAKPSPRNGDRALVGDEVAGIFEYTALNGVWRSESSLTLIDDLTERVEIIENEIGPVPDWAQEAINNLDF